MEINPNDRMPGSVFPEKFNTAEKSADKNFRTVFEELIDNSPKVDSVNKNAPLINSISQIRLNPFLSGEKISIADHADRVLDTLDDYQKKLASPAFTLKDIAPLIDEIEAGNKTLISASKALSDGDELKNILEQVIITSMVEIIKFNRGDYVNP